MKEPQKRNSGKGGNFDTRKNPFARTTQGQGTAPSVGDNAFLGQAIDRVVAAGCAIMLGQTRNGGTLCITILDGDDRHRTYCTTGDELDQAVAAMLEMYDTTLRVVPD